MKKLLFAVISFMLITSMCIYAGAETQTAYTASEFGYCDQSNPDSNFYSATNGQCKNSGASAYNRYMYYKFNLDSIEIPEGYSIQKVVFSVYAVTNYAKDYAAFNLCLYHVEDTSWNEQTITYKNMPARDSTRFAIAQVPAVSVDNKLINKYIDFDVTSYIKSKKISVTSVVSLAMFPENNGGDVAIQTLRGANVPKITVYLGEESVSIDSIKNYNNGAESVVMFVGDNQFKASVHNEYLTEKSVRLVAVIMNGSVCDGIVLGDTVVFSQDETKQMELFVSVPRGSDETRIFVVENWQDGLYPISMYKKIITKTGWK